MGCVLCKDRTSGPLCPECELVVLSTDVLYGSISDGTVRDELVMLQFLRELGFTFNRDPRVRKYFRVAQEIVIKSATQFMSLPIPYEELEELPHDTPALAGEIMGVLETAQVAMGRGEQVILADNGAQLVSLLNSGDPFGSPGFTNQREIVDGSLCIVLAHRMIHDCISGAGSQVAVSASESVPSRRRLVRRPCNYLLAMRRVCRPIVPFLNSDRRIPTDIGSNEFFDAHGDLSVIRSSKQRVKILTDMIYDYLLIDRWIPQPGGGLTIYWKPSVPPYQERLRERWRERRRAR